MKALMNAILRFYPEYAAAHNAEEAKYERGSLIHAFLKKSKQKRQSPVKGNWRSRIKYDNAGNTAMIMPVEGHNVSGQNSGFF